MCDISKEEESVLQYFICVYALNVDMRPFTV